MTDWRDIRSGPAAVAERDQFEAEVAEVVRESKLLFVCAAPLRPDRPEIVVRGLYSLSDGVDDVERADAAISFLVIARDELARMIDELAEQL